jgi:hypothetical protein
MFQDATADTDLDMRKVMRSVAQLNPHIALSDIAYLMDVPYEPEPIDYDNFDMASNY